MRISNASMRPLWLENPGYPGLADTQWQKRPRALWVRRYTSLRSAKAPKVRSPSLSFSWRAVRPRGSLVRPAQLRIRDREPTNMTERRHIAAGPAAENAPLVATPLFSSDHSPAEHRSAPNAYMQPAAPEVRSGARVARLDLAARPATLVRARCVHGEATGAKKN